MTYYNSIPASGQTLGFTRDKIRGNFALIQTAWDLNHVDFNLPGTGKHNFVTFPTQGSDPAISSPDINIYAKQIGATGFSQLFFQQGNGPSIYQLTGTATGATSVPSVGSNGYTYLPGGLMLQWWTATATNSTQSFPTAFPNNCFIAIGNVNTSPSGSVTTTILSKTQYTAKASGGNVSCYFIAIGN